MDNPIGPLRASHDPAVILPAIHEILHEFFGDLGWWPADSPFEVIVGAILTQNTAWHNVERAITNLKRETVLSPKDFKDIPESRLAELIQPAGYYRIKARRLKAFIHFLYDRFAGNIDAMFAESTVPLREQLLAVKGIGPETADSILLYAAQKPVFVVDAYTKRILSRHHLIADDADYRTIQQLFLRHLPMDTRLFNQYHALLVHTGKLFCKKQPLCVGCPLQPLAHI